MQSYLARSTLQYVLDRIQSIGSNAVAIEDGKVLLLIHFVGNFYKSSYAFVMIYVEFSSALTGHLWPATFKALCLDAVHCHFLGVDFSPLCN